MKNKITMISFFLISTTVWAGFDRLKQSWEIANYLEEVMQVSLKSGEPGKVYQAQRGLLPQKGNLSEANADSFMAILNLSSATCTSMITKDKNQTDIAKRVLHHGFDFEKNPNQAFDATTTEALFNEYSLAFWNRPLTAEEKIQWSELVQDLKSKSAQTPADTFEIVKAICISYASNFESLSVF